MKTERQVGKLSKVGLKREAGSDHGHRRLLKEGGKAHRAKTKSAGVVNRLPRLPHPVTMLPFGSSGPTPRSYYGAFSMFT